MINRAGGFAVADTSDIGTTSGAQAVVETALDTYGRLDIVVNNAGVVQFHSFADYPDDEFERMVDIHLRGAWHVNRAAWPHLAAKNYGRIVNTVSRGAFFGDPHGAAVEGGQVGIAVNAISPTAWTPLYASAPMSARSGGQSWNGTSGRTRWRGTGTVTLRSGPYDPAGPIPVLDVLGAAYQAHELVATCVPAAEVSADQFLLNRPAPRCRVVTRTTTSTRWTWTHSLSTSRSLGPRTPWRRNAEPSVTEQAAGEPR